MLRIIVRTQDFATAAHVDGAKADIEYRTFDIEAPEVEAYLGTNNSPSYVTREIVGVELIKKGS